MVYLLHLRQSYLDFPIQQQASWLLANSSTGKKSQKSWVCECVYVCVYMHIRELPKK